MKKIIFLLVALMFSTNLHAQQIQSATLRSAEDGSLKFFYGQNAFIEAHSVAMSGDTITLSEGQFNPCNIDKKLIINGAGMGNIDGSYTENQCSKFINYFYINKTVVMNNIEMSNYVYLKSGIEGIQFDRCKFDNYIETNGNEETNGCLCFTNCFIAGIRINVNYTDGVVFDHCYIGTGNSNPTTIFNNCVICSLNNSGIDIFKNCIMLKNITNNFNYTLCNCLLVGWEANSKVNIEGKLYSIGTDVKVFKANTFYELINPNSYVDENDVQIGLYGGEKTFDPFPTYPIITNLSVSNKLDSSGKINISFDIK